MDGDQDRCEIGNWNRKRKEVVLKLTQPMTASQLSHRLRLSLDRCSNVLIRLKSHGIVRCLNPDANRNRLFWLTVLGKRYQKQLAHSSRISHDVPNVDWQLYGSVCYSHRSEVIRSLAFPMQPATLRRRAAFRKPGLRMSANNVRDVMRYLKAHGIVLAVPLKKKAHPGYELTEVGLHMRRLLLQAEARG